MALSYLKSKVKSSRLATRIYDDLFRAPIKNHFNRDYRKRALLSYSTYHFAKTSYRAHSNYQESVVMAEVLDELGFVVDIENNNRETRLDLENYDLVIGEGLPMYQAAQLERKPGLIYYATGSHPWQCSEASLLRACEFSRRHGRLPLESTRLQDFRWGVAANLADLVICIGNETTKNTFDRYACFNVTTIRPTFHPAEGPRREKNLEQMSRARKSALWFGSYGLLHKGLDIAIEVFKARPDWTLHICGYTDREPGLIGALPENIKNHGFMNVESAAFAEIMNSTAFVVLPSCSEGIATSVITAMGRGGLIPVVTEECGVDIDDFGIKIEGLSSEHLSRSLDDSLALTAEELIRRSERAWHAANDNYTLANYRQTFHKILDEFTK